MVQAATPPNEFDLVLIECAVGITKPITETWFRVGGFADAGNFLNVMTRIVKGDGRIGSIRRVGDAILELMVGASDTSYTYLQTEGPMSPYFYHGCVALSSIGDAACRLTYTITYNQAAMYTDEQVVQRERISKRFQAAVEAMKYTVESGTAD
ncbi:SRPBCC family protein (plasmid) [Lichenicola cladoniae]|uniref:SRPBCC family protein n=1 Tax=Lichenicola cladoniae TaxID=1484109 RepID=A0A6M8HZ52_9PROT|nr:SRPBCC family protein [Lichenicola cladoniae]NPD70251.1 SRPBCC family protein [Acetobacteraceae bacterium]QKE93371.1 SRPBCC family protein [Lichenicola cladoniae]